MTDEKLFAEIKKAIDVYRHNFPNADARDLKIIMSENMFKRLTAYASRTVMLDHVVVAKDKPSSVEIFGIPIEIRSNVKDYYLGMSFCLF